MKKRKTTAPAAREVMKRSPQSQALVPEGLNLDQVGTRLQALEKLGASPREVMKALSESGVRDLEELVRRVLSRVSPEPVAIEDAQELPSSGRKERYVHRAPKLPFIVDDVLYDPDDVERFNGDALHFILRPDGTLVGFTGSKWIRTLDQYLTLVAAGSKVWPAAGYSGWNPWQQNPWQPHPYVGKGKSMAAGIPPLTPVGWANARFFEHAGFPRGDVLHLPAGRAWRDLTEVTRGWFGDWNDVISSVVTDGATIRIYEHTHYAGDSLQFAGGIVPNLEDFGWNDRVSSIKNFGNIGNLF